MYRVISSRKCRVVFRLSEIPWLRLGYAIMVKGLLQRISSLMRASVPW